MDKTLLIVYNGYNINKKRYGSKNDGGYIIIDNLNYDSYFSAGVGDNEDFTDEFLKIHKISKDNCFAFDGTVNKYPGNKELINFTKMNVSNIDNDININLENHMKKYDNIFLKMDIEGGEYPIFENLNKETLHKIKQLVIEFHGINDNSWGAQLEKKIQCLKKINESHYLVHAHGNNHEKCINNIPNVIELTYLRKNELSNPELNKLNLPIKGMDAPNNKNRADINLTMYPFVSTV